MAITNLFSGAICLLLAWIMLRFKTVGLIAGYNTASKEKQAKYDTDKLAKVTGLMLLYMGIDLTLFGFVYFIMPSMLLFWVSWGIFLAICLGGVVYMNTGKRCYKDEYK